MKVTDQDSKGSALDLIELALIHYITNKPDEDKVDLEDCKRMLEKVKAWKRLKDGEFKFQFWTSCPCYLISFTIDGLNTVNKKEIEESLDLLFGKSVK